MPRQERNNFHLASIRFNLFPSYDLIGGPVTTLNEDIGPQTRNNIVWCQVVEDKHSVNALKGRKDFGPLGFGNSRTVIAFQLFHAGIGIDSHHKDVAQLPGFF